MSNASTATNINAYQPESGSGFSMDKMGSLFSNKNYIIIVLLVLLILSLLGINILIFLGNVISNITTPLVPAIQDLLSMIGFTIGQLINGTADVFAGTADVGIDIAKGTTHSIGDLLINKTNPGIDPSSQVSLSEIVGIPNFKGAYASPQPVQSSEPTVTPISTQKPKAGWCYIGDFSGSRGCVAVSEHDKCMSGLIFANKAECLQPPK